MAVSCTQPPTLPLSRTLGSRMSLATSVAEGISARSVVSSPPALRAMKPATPNTPVSTVLRNRVLS